MAAHGGLGNECAGIVDRLLNTVGGVFAVIRDVRPDVENIGFGEWGKDVRHRRSNLSKKDFGWMWLAMPQNSGKFNYTTFRCRSSFFG
jgi:hypothetical protein